MSLTLGGGVFTTVCIGIVAAVAVRHFGWLEGLAILAAIHLLMPWPPVRS